MLDGDLLVGEHGKAMMGPNVGGKLTLAQRGPDHYRSLWVSLSSGVWEETSLCGARSATGPAAVRSTNRYETEPTPIAAKSGTGQGGA